MENRRTFWDDDRELGNLALVWAVLWNVLLWLVIVPLLITRPGPPAFYQYGTSGLLAWVGIDAVGLVPALVIFLRVRRLRKGTQLGTV